MSPDKLNESTVHATSKSLFRITREQASARVAAIIARRAHAAGLTEATYFRQIIAGRAPRITRSEVRDELSW